MRVPPKQGSPKFKLFNLLNWTHEIFKVTKYIKKIKFDQILRYRNGRSPKRGRQNSKLFNHTR